LNRELRSRHRAAAIFGLACDLVDERPLDVVVAQLTRAAHPGAAPHGIEEERRIKD